MIKSIDASKIQAKKPLPGWEFFLTDHNGDSAHFLVLGEDGDGIWYCAKVSIETEFIGPYDYLLDPDEWDWGFNMLLECWNILLLHEDDMPGVFRKSQINPEVLSRANELRVAYQTTHEIPKHLEEYTGFPYRDDDDFWQFRLREMGIIWMFEEKYHFKQTE